MVSVRDLEIHMTKHEDQSQIMNRMDHEGNGTRSVQQRHKPRLSEAELEFNLIPTAKIWCS
jgi:hypothetical protein